MPYIQVEPQENPSQVEETWSEGPSVPYIHDAEFELAESYYQKGLLLAEKDKENAIPLLQKSLDIFNKLGNEEWQQKVKIALESIK